jgi:hypothetical protein
MLRNTTGRFNSAFGYETLALNTTGANNTAIGKAALYNNTTASNNTAVGFNALSGNTTGIQNVVVGADAGDFITTGNYNVIMGYSAVSHASNLTTGINNTVLGSYTDLATASTNNANVLGHDVQGTQDYTTIGVGASDIRALHGNITWATVSDERYKKDIVDSEAGLSLINALRPRTFKYKTLGELPETFRAYKADSTKVFKNTQTNHGFIAQEVKAAIDADDSIKDGFRLWDDRPDGSQEVAETALIPVLVKAIQEQQTLIESLTDRITALEG